MRICRSSSAFSSSSALTAAFAALYSATSRGGRARARGRRGRLGLAGGQPEGDPGGPPAGRPTGEIALLLYAGGYSPGKFALEVASKLPGQLVKVEPELTLTIGTEQPRGKITSAVTALGSRREVELRTSIEPETDIRLRETYMDLNVSGQDVSLPSQARYERTLYVTYLDDELMIARDDTGTPDVLMRRSASPSAGSSEGPPARR